MTTPSHCHCCPTPSGHDSGLGDLSRRSFLAGMVAGGALLSGVTWASASEAAAEAIPDGVVGSEKFRLAPSPRKPLVVQPILLYDLPVRQEKASWRGWGGIDSKETAATETAAIVNELDALRTSSDFPVEFLPILAVQDVNQTRETEGVKNCDVLLVYGAGGGIAGVQNFGKDVIIFQRWKSGPVYLQYEIVSPRLLRQHTDSLALENITFEDVVTDSLEELRWRLRSLCGLKNTRDTRILAIGGPDAWAQSAESKEELYQNLRDKWRLDIQTVPYEKIDELLAAARADDELLAWSEKATDAYLALPQTTLSTTRESVAHCFVLDAVFRRLMTKADCHALTILGCMTTIIPKAQTTACLTLSTLNDDGWLAFCESDFAVIPSGILMANICGHPVFLNDPTYPHDGIVTQAHCTAPRKMDGKQIEAAQIVTHFESDYGAAPKVEMKIGQTVTNVLPDFKSKRWAGFRGEVVDNPFRPICRSQIDVGYEIPDEVIAERMPGFHWMTAYGDWSREIGYALRRVGIEWDNLEK